MRAMFEDARTVLLSLSDEIANLGLLRPGLEVSDAADMLMAFMCGHYECTLRHPQIYTADRDWRPLIDAALRSVFDISGIETRTPVALDNR